MVTQYWQVLNLDRRETLGQDSWGEMHGILQSTAPDGLIYQLLATDDRGSELADTNLVTRIKRNSLDNSKAPTDPSANPPSNLSFVNPRTDTTGPGAWATDRIVTISDYALAYPDGMLVASEMDEIEDMYLDDSEDEEYEEGDPAPTLYSFAEEWYGAVPVKFLTRGDVVPAENADGNENEEQGREPNKEKGREEQEHRKQGQEREQRELEQEQEQPILRIQNLSKKEYVRSDVIARICPERIVSQAREAVKSSPVAPGLGHALVLLTCWTSEMEIFGREIGEEVEEAEIGKGTWAGDRIEVRAVKDSNDNSATEGWKDVSDEVAGVLDAVWKSLAF